MYEYTYKIDTGEVVSIAVRNDIFRPSRLTAWHLENRLNILTLDKLVSGRNLIVKNGSIDANVAKPSEFFPSINKPTITSKNIIFYRTRGGLGDVVSTLSTVQSMKKAYPAKQIFYVGIKPFVDVLAEHPDIVKLIIKGENELPDGDAVVLDFPCPAGEYESFMLNKTDKSRNEIFTLASGLSWEKERPCLYLTVAESKKGKEFVEVAAQDKLKIGVALRTAEFWKDYPHTEKLIELCKEANIRVFTFDKSTTLDGCINTAGKSLREIMAILVYMDCVITPDTGIMHLCDALDVPCLALFGSMSARVHQEKYEHSISFITGHCPYRQQPCWYRVCEGKGNYQPCMTNIKPEFVLAKVREKIEYGEIKDQFFP